MILWLEVLLEEDPRQSDRELPNKLQLDHSTVLRSLLALGKIIKVPGVIKRVFFITI